MTVQTRFGGPERSPGFLLWRVTLAWQRAMRAALAPHDLTHVQFVLLATGWWLGRHEPPTQQTLAERAGTDTMMTSQVIRKLAERGLVTRQEDPADARAKRITVTSAGLKVLKSALADVEQVDVEFFARLGRRTDGFVDGLASLVD
ncbi:MarR family winged helix-turn-helix transcriptional regulator [Actinocrispum wychmicini]|uniref:DNA-binding MarR family transcriptional regulator n=1 Tax=Actinocrispum wychmicini TaxID=1213861 RepID=A0A4V6NNW9_9PSEU|nr:MarR family transcriptional regulator [Actinocrispum wychmicini]TCO58420.1 DNA-binding MarR family transcriptional regulator [Actinocrispum wychmicini]